MTALKAQSNIQDSTTISYYRLGEFAKYVEFKKQGDSLISKLSSDIKKLESLNNEQKKLSFELQKIQIPNLKNQITLLSTKVDNSYKILSIREDYFKAEIKRLRSGKLKFGIAGAAIGVVIGLLAF